MAGTYPGPQVIPTPNIGNAASVLVAPPNPSRVQLYIFNIGPNTIWVSPITNNSIQSIIAGVGIQGSVPLAPNTGNFFPAYTNGMQAIAAGGATNALTIWEYYQ